MTDPRDEIGAQWFAEFMGQAKPGWSAEPECQDCGAALPRSAEENQGTVRHDDSCAYAADLDRMSEADREFFERHPHAAQFYRRPYPNEVTQFRASTGLSHADGSVEGKVLVRRLGDGVRSRNMSGLRFVPDPAYLRQTKQQYDEMMLEAVAVACEINGCVIVTPAGEAIPCETLGELAGHFEDHSGAAVIVSDTMRAELESWGKGLLPNDTWKASDPATGRYAVAFRIP